ncbi:hypothetical protein [Sphingopyxis sp. BSNA05]|uniref:hypothetical protein n=1 Tax=Sphingopyxis sp. BSNA05 TaxID=1236614 RepID=UPI001565F9E6|nr:hypothetical protein [Sphingopyxis sp. BSNA05]
MILLGDFNIVHPDHETMTALKRHGFRIPNALNRPSNLDLSKYYDQIAFMTDDDTLNFIDRQTDDPKKANAGIFEIFKSVYRDGDTLEYEKELRKKAGGKDKQARRWANITRAAGGHISYPTTNRCGCGSSQMQRPPIWNACGRTESRPQSGDHRGFAEMFGKTRLHRLACDHRQRERGFAMGAFGADPSDMPVRFATTWAAVNDIEMIERLIAPLLSLFGQWLNRLIDE